MQKIVVIIKKEWGEVFKNRLVLFTVGFLPIIMTALPLITLYASGSTEEMIGMSEADLPARFANLCEGLSPASCGQYFIVSQFMMLFMLMPLAIPVTIASYSIVGEKTTRTLEPVLATPIKTWELLVGKGLAAGIPAILATWISFLIFIVGAIFLAAGPDLIRRLIDPLWLTAVFVVGPLLAIAAISVAVMISSRANDPRVAEQLSMLVVIPLLGLFFAQVAGLVYIDRLVILWMALAVAVLDVVLLYFATLLFQREAILTRWR
jgi:ABC-2 type transport system permease protein